MNEYIIEWSGIGARIVDLIGSVPTCLIPKRLREERLREEIVRCRDCAYSIHFLHHDDERWQCAEPHQEGDDVNPKAYCWRGKRKEGGDD